jgi:hypothetical protein
MDREGVNGVEEWLMINKAETYGNSISKAGFPEMTCFAD